VVEFYQNRTARKDRFFFENLPLLKSKSAKLMKVWQQPGACAQEIADQKDILRISRIFMVQRRNLF
jgi:hypothetical protein